jgi:hypothetical protein
MAFRRKPAKPTDLHPDIELLLARFELILKASPNLHRRLDRRQALTSQLLVVAPCTNLLVTLEEIHLARAELLLGNPARALRLINVRSSGSDLEPRLHLLRDDTADSLCATDKSSADFTRLRDLLNSIDDALEELAKGNRHRAVKLLEANG